MRVLGHDFWGNSVSTVHVIVTCSNRKHGNVPASLRLQNVRGSSVKVRAKRWLNNLASFDGIKRSACETYKGNHWAVARSIPDKSNANCKVKLWVCSAGYGLIPASAEIHPYGATFTPGHSDSIASSASRAKVQEELSDWWSNITEASPIEIQNTRISSLVRENPKDGFLISLSEYYLIATTGDILEASQLSERVAVLATSTQPELKHCTIEVDSRFQQLLGGSKVSFGARLARKAVSYLSEAPFFSFKFLENAFAYDLSKCTAVKPPNRAPMSDEAVKKFVEKQFRLSEGEAPPSKTRLLRRLRELGKACEQKRFGRLYSQIREEFCVS